MEETRVWVWPNEEDCQANRDWFGFWLREAALRREYPKVEPWDFYRYIFPEGSFERLGHPEDGKGNGIAVSINEETRRASKTIITDGLEQLGNLLEEPLVVCSPISYFGRSRRADHALWLHALTLDIDYVSPPRLDNIIRWFEELEIIPRPAFIVNSGHGIHLYYVFDSPVAMYPKNQRELLKLKKGLIDKIWTKYTSDRPERKEALGIVQGFRMVGSRTKMPQYRLSAWQTGSRVSLEYLNGFSAPGAEAKVDATPSLFSLEDAKREWPEWYEKRVVRGERAGRWHVKRDLYDWWKRRIAGEAQVGARYFCIMALAIYAAKCDVSEEELREDAARFQVVFDALGDDTNEPFSWEEAEKALEAYNESYVTFPRDDIARLTKIAMPANKRNGRKQKVHLAIARGTKEAMKSVEAMKPEGRPKGSAKLTTPKAKLIRDYALEHPEANHSEIARVLGVSRPTVIKWLKDQSRE